MEFAALASGTAVWETVNSPGLYRLSHTVQIFAAFVRFPILVITVRIIADIKDTMYRRWCAIRAKPVFGQEAFYSDADQSVLSMEPNQFGTAGLWTATHCQDAF